MKSLIYSLLLIFILFSCQQKDLKTENKQEQAEITVDPSLYKKMVTDNPTIDSATYNMLVMHFPDIAQFHAYAGSEVNYYGVYSANAKPELWKFAYATIRNDTLWINVKSSSAMSEMFGGDGISFMVEDNKISADYSQWNDVKVGPDDSGEINIPASENSLTLNTNQFTVGDTIAGKLTYKEPGGMYASGYFRAIIKGE